eukprot:351884-Chlamydomonas_euryale.AAC.5
MRPRNGPTVFRERAKHAKTSLRPLSDGPDLIWLGLPNHAYKNAVEFYTPFTFTRIAPPSEPAQLSSACPTLTNRPCTTIPANTCAQHRLYSPHELPHNQ